MTREMSSSVPSVVSNLVRASDLYRISQPTSRIRLNGSDVRGSAALLEITRSLKRRAQ